MSGNFLVYGHSESVGHRHFHGIGYDHTIRLRDFHCDDFGHWHRERHLHRQRDSKHHGHQHIHVHACDSLGHVDPLSGDFLVYGDGHRDRQQHGCLHGDELCQRHRDLNGERHSHFDLDRHGDCDRHDLCDGQYVDSMPGNLLVYGHSERFGYSYVDNIGHGYSIRNRNCNCDDFRHRHRERHIHRHPDCEHDGNQHGHIHASYSVGHADPVSGNFFVYSNSHCDRQWHRHVYGDDLCQCHRDLNGECHSHFDLVQHGDRYGHCLLDDVHHRFTYRLRYCHGDCFADEHQNRDSYLLRTGCWLAIADVLRGQQPVWPRGERCVERAPEEPRSAGGPRLQPGRSAYPDAGR